MNNPESERNESTPPFRFASIEGMLYPAPTERTENPQPTELQKGDMVDILVGPAAGKVGLVVVERNGNYKDSEPYASPESIGVQVIQQITMDETLRNALIGTGNVAPDSTLEQAIRWFDEPDQLRLAYRDTSELDTKA
jgi:hypothetical protein